MDFNKGENIENVQEFSTAEINHEEWGSLWKQVKCANMVQSWEYGNAKYEADGWKPIRLVI